MSSARCFRNTFTEPAAIDEVEARKGIARAILEGIDHVRSSLTVSPNGIAPSGTVYVGSAGFAYMFFHLARHVQHGSLQIPRHVVILRPRNSQKPTTSDTNKRNSPVTAEELYRLALTICDTAITATSQFPGRCTFLEGYAGPLALRCAILSALARHQEAQQCAEALTAYVASAAAALPPSECEVLYGRAGLLYALLFAERLCPHVTMPADLFQTLIQDIISEGQDTARRMRHQGMAVPNPCLMYKWHGKAYLGAAHGVVGVLHVLAMSMHHVQKMPNGSDIEMWIRASAGNVATQLVHDSGNLPSSFGSSRDELVHWCHGAPGMAMMLAMMSSVFGSAYPHDFDQFMQRSLSVVWQRGLLKKGIGLCHGIPGNGYAFLAAHRTTAGPQFYEQALSFGIFAVQVKQELLMIPDRPMSMFEGLAGAICFWADLLSPELAHFPGFELPSLLGPASTPAA
eukprot:jgi/Ulvmu1/5260/UM022_0054.1